MSPGGTCDQKSGGCCEEVINVDPHSNLPIDPNWVSKVPQFLIDGVRAERIVPVAEDYDVFDQNAVLRVDQYGFFLNWKGDGREGQTIETCQISDVRRGARGQFGELLREKFSVSQQPPLVPNSFSSLPGAPNMCNNNNSSGNSNSQSGMLTSQNSMSGSGNSGTSGSINSGYNQNVKAALVNPVMSQLGSTAVGFQSGGVGSQNTQGGQQQSSVYFEDRVLVVVCGLDFVNLTYWYFCMDSQQTVM
ncbi:uncharacterized protein LOC134856325, partial [Symsagittifera roscoffensis]